MAIRGKLELCCAILLPYEDGNSDAAIPGTKSLPLVYNVIRLHNEEFGIKTREMNRYIQMEMKCY